MGWENSKLAQTAILSNEQKVQNWQGRYLWLVGLFYAFQGFFFYGTRIYALTMMANWGVVTNTQATVFAILGIPGYLKVIPGLLSDRLPLGTWGRRKPYIFLGGLLYIPGYLLLIGVQTFGAIWVAAILLILTAWLLADTALDALTVDTTPLERTGQLQSAAQSSRLAGAVLGTLLVPLLGPRIGWTPVLIVMAIGALASSAAALFIREFPITRETLKRELPLKSVFQQTFNQKIIWLGLFFLLFFSATQATSNLLSIYLLSESGWGNASNTLQNYAIVDVFKRIASVCGAILAGWLASKWLTSFRFYVGFIVINWILWLPWLLVNRSPENLTLVTIAIILVGIGVGFGGVLELALAMRLCKRSIEGFTFALLMSVSSFGVLTIGAKTASAFVERLGGVIPAIFTLIPYGLLSLVFLYPLLRLMNRKSE